MKKKGKTVKAAPGQDFNPETHFEGTVFIDLIAKDQLTRKCAHYLPNQIIYI